MHIGLTYVLAPFLILWIPYFHTCAWKHIQIYYIPDRCDMASCAMVATTFQRVCRHALRGAQMQSMHW